MLIAFRKHIEEQFPLLVNKKILVAISGGVDSVVLTHLFHKMGYKISLAHCNFKLRGDESDLDEEHVYNYGKNLNCKVYSTTFNTSLYAKQSKESIQLAARNLRYTWFHELIKENDLDYIATAHHANDNLETFLFNLTRGAGLEGLTGIPKQTKTIIRPLLPFTKEAIVDYAKQNNLAWREDKSNLDIKYTRNAIRSKVIPILKEINPSLLNSFANTIQYLEESKQIIDDKVDEIKHEIIEEQEDVLKIDIEKMLKLSTPKAYLYQLLKSYNFTEWENVYDLLFAQSGKEIISRTHVLLKDRSFLLLYKKQKKTKNNNEYLVKKGVGEINTPIHLKIEDTIKKQGDSKNCALVNKNLVTFPMILRRWKEGDFFYPAGMSGKKKISKFFKDQKLSKLEKQNVWLLCNNDNAIIWVIGMRQDRRFLTNLNSEENIIKLSVVHK